MSSGCVAIRMACIMCGRNNDQCIFRCDFIVRQTFPGTSDHHEYSASETPSFRATPWEKRHGSMVLFNYASSREAEVVVHCIIYYSIQILAMNRVSFCLLGSFANKSKSTALLDVMRVRRDLREVEREKKQEADKQQPTRTTTPNSSAIHPAIW